MPALLSAVALALAIGPSPLVHEPIRVSGYWPPGAHRTLQVQITRGVCSHHLRLRTLRQGARSVGLAFQDEIDPGVVCPALAKLECRAVVLTRPLGSRRVVDLTDGERARALRPGDPGSARPRACPRISPP